MNNTKNQVVIIGYGYVGKAMNLIFPDALIYDPKHNGLSVDKDYVNENCGLAIVAVPTPPKGMNGEQRVDEDETVFREVDLSIIEETIAWLDVPLILIKSTIPPGTTDHLREKYGKKICFSPEYIGEGNYYTPPRYPDPLDPRKHDFMIIGGEKEVADEILTYFIEKLGPAKTYFKCSAKEAECIKYMENTWGFQKVIFCNEWFEICKIFGISYNTVREGFLLDSRTEPMHTAVFANKRGVGGKCFPKDLLGIVSAAEKAGYEPKLLKEVWESNKRFRAMNLQIKNDFMDNKPKDYKVEMKPTYWEVVLSHGQYSDYTESHLFFAGNDELEIWNFLKKYVDDVAEESRYCPACIDAITGVASAMDWNGERYISKKYIVDRDELRSDSSSFANVEIKRLNVISFKK